MQPGYFLVGLEPATEHISVRRAPAREGEHSGQPGVKGDERQMRLDVKPSCFQSNPISDGSMRNRHIRFTPDETASKVFQLEARPRGGGDRCFQPRLVSCKGLCQWCLIARCLSQTKRQMARLVVLWNTQPWFPTILSLLEDYPHLLPTRTDLVILPTGQEFIMKQGVPELIAWSISGNPLHHKEFLHRLQTSSWRTKTKSNYNSLFAKWADWCQQRDRNPTSGPVKDIINFLAELYNAGYQYRSLNSYRSAISVAHSKVDDHPVGQHPLVSRILKGIYNERPPLPRYSTFWDVGVVLRYLKKATGEQ